jgi:hypothetical protein
MKTSSLATLFSALFIAAIAVLTGCSEARSTDSGRGEPREVAQTLGTACTAVVASPAPASATPVGTPSVTVTATATCGGTPEYQFWTRPAGGAYALTQDWGAAPTYLWDTSQLGAGSYSVRVYARNQGSTAPYEASTEIAYTLTPAGQSPCVAAMASVAPASPASAGTPSVTVTATATCGGTPEYQFWVRPAGGAWAFAQDWSVSSTYLWNTSQLGAGSYFVAVNVRNQGSTAPYEAFTEVVYTLTPAGQTLCTAATATTAPISPTSVGTPVTITATATCGGTAEYQFWVRSAGGAWTIAQDWGVSPTYVWDTSQRAAGSYSVKVYVRNQGSAVPYEASTEVAYTLTPTGPTPCTAAGASAAPPSPTSVGTPVSITATATCGGTPQYQFWIRPVGGARALAQDWSGSPTYLWNTSQQVAGDYSVEVYVRDQGSTAAYEASTAVLYTLTATAPVGCATPCTLPNATAACSNGVCTVVSCNPGFADCNGNPVDGCELSIAGDPNHCGSCTTSCAIPNGTAACSNGVCSVGSCNAGYADCNGNPTDGCELNLASDPNHCGSCTTACAVPNATAACNGGVCSLGSCNAGYADCNGNSTDGCEQNISSDPTHCGSCSTRCALPNATAACTNGACTVASCSPGYGDVNGDPRDGCEKKWLAPSQIFSNIVAWWAFDRDVTVDGNGRVQYVKEQKNGNAADRLSQASAANRPYVVASDLNFGGRQVINANGLQAGHDLRLVSDGNTFWGSAQPNTVIVVGRVDNTGGTKGSAIWSSYGGNFDVARYGSTGDARMESTAGSRSAGILGTKAFAWKAYFNSNSSSSQIRWSDGTMVDTGPFSVTNLFLSGAVAMNYNRNNGNPYGFPGAIADIIVLTGAVSADEWNTFVANWLQGYMRWA